MIFAVSPNAYVLLDRDFTIRDMNEAYLNVTMRRREEITGRGMFEAFPAGPDLTSRDSVARLRASLEQALRSGEPDHLAFIKYDIPRPGGGFEERYWSATHTPLKDEDGHVALVLQHTVDVTELHRLRQLAAPGEPPTPLTTAETGIMRRAEAVDATNRLLDEERRYLRSLFEQAPGFMAVMRGADHVFELVNAAFVHLVRRRDLIGRRLAEALPEVAEQGFPELLDDVYRTGRPFVGRGVPIVLDAEPGEPPRELFIDFVYQPILGPDGAVTGIFVQGHDVSDLKRAEEHQRLLVHELSHRVKNSLAVVQAIASQTLKGSDPLPVARETFVARLMALARAHDLLIEENWEGADLRDVVSTALSAIEMSPPRVTVSGEGARIAPKTALSLAMALHELATNATKYGALSADGGRVDVTWSISGEGSGRRFLLRWRESDGPAVDLPPHRGFGSRLIERGLATELGGEAKIHFEREGVVCTIDAPLPYQ